MAEFKQMVNWILKIPWWIVIVGCLTLGLAPFQPLPHLVEKTMMLFDGELYRPIDVFDLLLHSAFPALLVTKIILTIRRNK